MQVLVCAISKRAFDTSLLCSLHPFRLLLEFLRFLPACISQSVSHKVYACVSLCVSSELAAVCCLLASFVCYRGTTATTTTFDNERACKRAGTLVFNAKLAGASFPQGTPLASLSLSISLKLACSLSLSRRCSNSISLALAWACELAEQNQPASRPIAHKRHVEGQLSVPSPLRSLARTSNTLLLLIM